MALSSPDSSEEFYSKPTTEQLVALESMAKASLALWDAEEATITPIKYRENAVFSVARPDGERFALRIHRPGYRSDQHVRSEFMWMRALADHGLLTPAPIPTRQGEPFAYVSVDGVPEPRRCDALTWIDGSPLGSIEEGASGALDAKLDNYRTLGELAARIHEFGASWSPPPDFHLPSWDGEALVGDDPEWGRFWELECLSDPQRERILEARNRVREKLQDFGATPDRFGLLHGDFLPENVLISGDTAHLLDFNDAGTGWYLFEFATTLFFLQPDPDFARICEALMDGYRSAGATAVDYEAMMPTMMMARGLSYLGWPHSRPEIDEARMLAPFLAAQVVELCDVYLAGELHVPGG